MYLLHDVSRNPG